MKVLWNQQIRWQRSGIRDFILTLETLPQHIWELAPNPNFLYGLVFPTLAASVATFVLAINPGVILAIAPFWVVFYMVMASIYCLYVRKVVPEQRIANPLLIFSLVFFTVWIVAGRLIEICAACTLDSTSWMTRQNSEKKA